MGKHHILTSVHAPKQVMEVMSFAHHEHNADLCATDVKEIAYTSTMELVLSCTRADVFIISIPTWL